MSLFCFILGWIISLIIAFIALPLSWIKKDWGQECQRLFGIINLWLMDIRLKVHGLENLKELGGAILAPNHESLFDILVIASLPLHKSWLAKKQVKYIPFIGQVMQALGSQFVARNRSEKDIRVLREIEKVIQDGTKIVIFPEGTRTRTGELLPFKKGAFRTAMNAGVPLLPIAITGTYEIAPPGHWPTRSHAVVVRIGKPLYPHKDETVESLIVTYKKELLALLKNDRS